MLIFLIVLTWHLILQFKCDYSLRHTCFFTFYILLVKRCDNPVLVEDLFFTKSELLWHLITCFFYRGTNFGRSCRKIYYNSKIKRSNCLPHWWKSMGSFSWKFERWKQKEHYWENKKDYEKVYDKSYAMLTTLMEQHGRNDWLFIKTCYKNIPGSSQIVREMEVIINQHIKGMLFQYYDIRSRYFENQQSLICLHHQWEGSMDGFVFSTNAL